MVKYPNCAYRTKGRTLITQDKVKGCSKFGNVCYPEDDCIEPSSLDSGKETEVRK